MKQLRSIENNVIFLDFDGVINDNGLEVQGPVKAESYLVLRRLVRETQSRIVVISSWLMNGTKSRQKKIKLFLNKLGFSNIDFIDPNFTGVFLGHSLSDRALGIIHYLSKNRVDGYVILDDEYDFDYQLLRLNYYKTNMFRGLIMEDLPKIKLKAPFYQYSKFLRYEYRKLDGEYECAIDNLVKVLIKVRDKTENDRNNDF